MITNGTTIKRIPINTEYDVETPAGCSKNNMGVPHPRNGGTATPTEMNNSTVNRRNGRFPEKKAVYRVTHSVLDKVISDIIGIHRTEQLSDMLSTQSRVFPRLDCHAKPTIVVNV